MSLAKQIIHGTDKQVAADVASGSVLNELDEYGYNPIVQTAIVNSASKAKILLEAGAEVDFKDLTGRSALHWAADNNSCELVKLLLKHGADANAYTFAGQSPLVMPLLRKHKPIMKLLQKHGADLGFAQDFINAKLLGHRYELEGRVDLVDHQNTFIETETEGFYLEFTLSQVAESLYDFRRNFAGKRLKKYFAKIDYIIQSLRTAAELIKYQHYLLNVEEHQKRIDRLLDIDPLILPIAFAGHAITLIRFGSLLIRCDRGEYGRKHGTVIFYHMPDPYRLNKSLIKEILYRRQTKDFINTHLARMLKLETLMNLHILPQKVGNCSWANVEAVVPAVLLALLLDERGIDNLEVAQQEALLFFDEWVLWERERALYFCMQSFYESDPARKAAKATLMTAVLYQRCDYENRDDQEKAKRILAILNIPEYRYILKGYLQVFKKDKGSIYYKNLLNFMDDFGVVID
ncbi:MAG: ankyrin repeat domain-containing protein [Gammaproteobacteria bacterium]|nr:ankyrin repeat domain-containing protein [Gammaproteobacteria bacterium]